MASHASPFAKAAGAIVDDSPNDGDSISTAPARQSLLASVKELTSLSATLLLPYVFHPLAAIDVYLPHIAQTWPFSSAPAFDPATSIPSLVGKVVLVTGGNTGIGKETVLQLARHHPRKIFLASRTESKSRDAIASIKAQVSGEIDIEHLPLDLVSLPSIRAAADQVTSHSDRLDILILNAGIMAVPNGQTASGQEIQMGTNHVGHFLLTKLLLPRLQETAKVHDADVRVVTLTSEAWRSAPDLDTILSTEKLCKAETFARYGASKAANILFAAELARRCPTLTSVSVHPGLIQTDLYVATTTANPITRYAAMFMGPVLFSGVETGALNSLWAAAGANKDELVNGGYYTPVGKHAQNIFADDPEGSRRLWEWTEAELSAAGY